MPKTVHHRAIVNFAHTCALNCKWCYVPFGGPPVRASTVFAIVDRLRTLGFETITFGGGDPFQYSFVQDLLLHAKAAGFFVHVDTHGKGLRENDATLALLDRAVDLLGLPLDGSSAAIHDQVRSTHGHFDLVRSRLRWLTPILDRTKLNTILTSQNVSDCASLADLVAQCEPGRWSLYQFWRLGVSDAVSADHELPTREFLEAAENAKARTPPAILVEINDRDCRRGTYPLIHHDGSVYVHAPHPQHSLLYLGNVSDASIYSRMQEACGSERAVAADRYRKTLPLLRQGRMTANKSMNGDKGP